MAGGERTSLAPVDDDRAKRRTVVEHRHGKNAPPAAGQRDLARIHRVGEYVVDLRDCAREDCPPRSLIGLRWSWIHLLEDVENGWRVVVMGDEVHQFTIEAIHGAHARAAEAHRVGDDGVEDRLGVGLRPADHP